MQETHSQPDAGIDKEKNNVLNMRCQLLHLSFITQRTALDYQIPLSSSASRTLNDRTAGAIASGSETASRWQ
jgi:hypothetical protein